MSPPGPDEMARVRRRPDRASYDDTSVYGVLDAGFVCHVAVVRHGRPVVLPTLYARDGHRLLLHGSTAAGVFRDLRRDPRVCVAVTHVDGLVLARSAFHHSVNYRSVVVHGRAEEIVGDEARQAALRTLVEHIAPGQWASTRPPTPDELRQTTIWSVSLDTASAKVRTGPPGDDPPDYDLPAWAGVLPLALRPGPLRPDDGVATQPPQHLLGWQPPGERS